MGFVLFLLSGLGSGVESFSLSSSSSVFLSGSTVPGSEEAAACNNFTVKKFTINFYQVYTIPVMVADGHSSRGTHRLFTSSITWPSGHAHIPGMSHTMESQKTKGLRHVAGQLGAHCTGFDPLISHGFSVTGSVLVLGNASVSFIFSVSVGSSDSVGCLVSGAAVTAQVGQHPPKGTVGTPFAHIGGTSHRTRSQSEHVNWNDA